MTTEQMMTILGAAGSTLLVLLAFFKWLTDWVEKRDADQQKFVDEQNKSINIRLDRHKDEFEKLHNRIGATEQQLHETREHYIKATQMEALRKELREDFNTVFERMGKIAEGLNQLIGSTERGRRSDDG